MKPDQFIAIQQTVARLPDGGDPCVLRTRSRGFPSCATIGEVWKWVESLGEPYGKLILTIDEDPNANG